MLFVKIPGQSYEMKIHPVTQQEWSYLMGNNPSKFRVHSNNPVETVSWDDCQEYIKKLNTKNDGYTYSLPTEEQWEYCCKAGSTTKWCFGDDEEQLKEYAWYYKNSNNTTQVVGQKKPNAWGLYDMHGNVWEWTSSPEGSIRVIRGGSWDYNAEDLRSAYRYNVTPSYRYNVVGLRLVRDIVSLGNFYPFTLSSSSEAVRKPDRSECAHKYVQYFGLSESFNYCKTCGEKE